MRKSKPRSDPWGWYVGPTSDVAGPFNSREEAITDATSTLAAVLPPNTEEAVLVGVMRPIDPADWVPGVDAVLELMNTALSNSGLVMTPQDTLCETVAGVAALRSLLRRWATDHVDIYPGLAIDLAEAESVPICPHPTDQSFDPLANVVWGERPEDEDVARFNHEVGPYWMKVWSDGAWEIHQRNSLTLKFKLKANGDEQTADRAKRRAVAVLKGLLADVTEDE